MPPCTAAVALGSNLGDRAENLRAAARSLGRLGRTVARSGLYETAPVGPPQPSFLNAVVLLETGLDPHRLLEGLLGIESALGRVRNGRWRPRTIDLDLLAVDDQVVREPLLVLPHPEAHRRAFVLVPLAEVAPDFVLPGYGSVDALLAALDPTARAAVRKTGLAF